jgi:hypothetical protein
LPCPAAITIARVYSNCADRSQYKAIFDAFQCLTERLTGKRILLKRISKNGTLLCFHVDFEAAQVLGLGDSFLPTNEPDHSGLPKDTDVEIFVQSFCRGCYAHGKRYVLHPIFDKYHSKCYQSRGVHALRPYVNDEQYDRLINFPYMKTEAEVQQFGKWIEALGIKEVHGMHYMTSDNFRVLCFGRLVGT